MFLSELFIFCSWNNYYISSFFFPPPKCRHISLPSLFQIHGLFWSLIDIVCVPKYNLFRSYDVICMNVFRAQPWILYPFVFTSWVLRLQASDTMSICELYSIKVNRIGLGKECSLVVTHLPNMSKNLSLIPQYCQIKPKTNKQTKNLEKNPSSEIRKNLSKPFLWFWGPNPGPHTLGKSFTMELRPSTPNS